MKTEVLKALGVILGERISTESAGGDTGRMGEVLKTLERCWVSRGGTESTGEMLVPVMWQWGHFAKYLIGY